MVAFGGSTATKPPDYKVSHAGNDGISSLTFAPNSNYLVSTNWDGGVRCWECQTDRNSGQVQAIPKAQGTLEIHTLSFFFHMLFCKH